MKDAPHLFQWARFPRSRGVRVSYQLTYITLSLSTYLSSLVRPSVRPSHSFVERTIITIPYRSNPYRKHGLFPAATRTHSLQPFVGGGTKAAMLCYILYASTYSLLRGQPVSQSGLFPDLHFTTSPASSAFHSYSYYLLYPPTNKHLERLSAPLLPALGRTKKIGKNHRWFGEYGTRKSGEEEKKKKKWVYKKKVKKREEKE